MDPFEEQDLYSELINLYGGFEEPAVVQQPIQEEIKPNPNEEILKECEKLLERFQSFMSNEDNADVALGMDMGMNMAAEWLENMIKNVRDHG